MRKNILSVLATAGAFVAGVAVVGAVALPASPVSAAKSTKITICHRTHSVTNPYRRITVARASITKARGHGDQGAQDTHNKATSVNPTRIVWDPTYSYPDAPRKVWNDIIPDASTGGGAANIAQNFSGRGLAIYNGTVDGGYDYKNACKKMTAKQFYDSEVAEGQTPADILDDLNDQQSNEDKALKDACGGTFSASCAPSTWEDKVKVETKDPTDVTKTTAKLNGVVTCGADASGAPVKYYFEWSTDSALASATATSVTAVASNGQTVNVSISGLAVGTYYYRTICVTDYELETEGVIEGEIKQFSITANTPETTAPAESSTSSTSSTAAPATTAAPAKGKVTGKVWLEIKKDAKHDAKEPLLSGLTVTLKSGATVAGTKTTGSNGDFEFTDLAPGSYIVTVTAPSTGGIERSSDSDGSGDWIVTVTVKANETATAEYAAVGTAKTGGTAVRVSGKSTNVIANAKITCTWAGADGELGTDDDVDFSTTAADDGTYLIKGIPTGAYECVAKDPATGKTTTTDGVKVTAASAAKSDAAVKTALLKISGTATSLPATGSRPVAPMVLAFFLLISGAFVLNRSRRRV